MPSNNPTPLCDAEVQRLYDAKNWNAGKAFDFARRIETVMHKLADALDGLYNDGDWEEAERMLAEYRALMETVEKKEGVKE